MELLAKSKYQHTLTFAVTLVSVSAIILETVPELSSWKRLFDVVEWTTVTYFTYEYFSHIYSSKNKVKYVLSFWGILDLLCILPTLVTGLNLTFLKSARSLRILRLLRMARLAKIAHSQDVSIQSHSKAMIYFASLSASVVVLGSALYVVADDAPGYQSIPLAMVEAARLLVGGIGFAPIAGTLGEIMIIATRFVGLALFGLLISVVGGTLNSLLFGKE